MISIEYFCILQQENALLLDFDEKNTSAAGGNVVSKYTEEGCVAWDPHSANQCAVGIGSGLKLVDTREMEVTAQHHTAHENTIR